MTDGLFELRRFNLCISSRTGSVEAAVSSVDVKRSEACGECELVVGWSQDCAYFYLGFAISVVCVCHSFVWSAAQDDYCKSKQPVSPKLAVMSQPTNRKYWLTSGMICSRIQIPVHF